MVLPNPTPLSLIDELLVYARSENPHKRKWLTRKVRALPLEEQERVWAELATHGVERPEPTMIAGKVYEQPGQSVLWTDEEWDKLAAAVWLLRKNEPALHLVALARRCQEQLPEERRRVLRTTRELDQLIDRLTWMDEKGRQAEDEVRRLKQRLEEREKSPTGEEVLQTLTDKEVLRQFGRRVLSLTSPADLLSAVGPEDVLACVPLPDLLARAARALGETMAELAEVPRATSPAPQSTTSPSAPPPPPPTTPTRLPRVTVVGLLPNQQRRVEEALGSQARLHFVDKNREDTTAIPENQDVILLACNFIGHGIQELAKRRAAPHTKLVLHHGGMELLVRRLDRVLREEL